MNGILNITDDSFEEEVLKSEMPVLVEFGASWCGPCVRQILILEKFATENSKKVKVCKIDVDDSPTTTSKFGIRGVPVIILFNHGKKIDMKVGRTSNASLNNLLIEKIGI